MASTCIVSIWGEDRPGIAASLFGVLGRVGARLVDLDQLASHGRTFLSLVLETDDPAALEASLGEEARGLGLHLEVTRGAVGEVARSRWELTVIGRALLPAHLERIFGAVVRAGGNVERMVRMGRDRSIVFHFSLTLAPQQADGLRGDLLRLAEAERLDLALQRESVYRRNKRLVVMDMDSTLIRIEVIDELARAHGVYDQVAAITERAMQGELDFDQSLRARVALLRGMDAAILEDLASRLPLMEGAEALVSSLRLLGYRLAVVSGGFTPAAEALRSRLGLDYAHANQLEVADGKLTGGIVGPIVNAERKAELLESIAKKEGIRLDQVIAVGDGANDLLMLRKAGMGIAFRAKPRLREAADVSISESGLDAILFLLGFTERELEELQT